MALPEVLERLVVREVVTLWPDRAARPGAPEGAGEALPAEFVWPVVVEDLVRLALVEDARFAIGLVPGQGVERGQECGSLPVGL